MDARRSPARAALVLAVWLVGTAGLVEALVRTLRPAPRLQIVRPDDTRLAFTDALGVPVWWEVGEEGPVRHLDCAGAGGPRVYLAGDSVLYAIDEASHPHRVAPLLQARLVASGLSTTCVLDGSQPAFVPEQQLALARATHAEVPLDLLVLLVWKADRRYVRLGPALYDTEAVHADATGLPVPPLPVPWALHRWAFPRSRAWEYATLARAPALPTPSRPGETAYLEAIGWAAAAGVDLVFLEAAPLARPLDETRDARRAERARVVPAGQDGDWRRRLQRAAEAQAIPYLFLDELLTDARVEDVRLDTCCHLNGEGHARVADGLARALVPRLE